MNTAPAYRTPTPRKSRSKRPPRISPEDWKVLVENKRRLDYALYRGWLSERLKAKIRVATLLFPDAMGGFKHL